MATQDLFTAIWEQTTGPAWVARHGLSSADYQSAFDQYVGQGYRLRMVSGYASGGGARYAALWDKSTGGAWVARHGLSSAEYQAAFDQFVAQGYRLRTVSGYEVGGVARYAALWEKASGGAWLARHGLSSSDYQALVNQIVPQGYRPRWVDCYTVGGQDRYATIWEVASGPAWAARHGMSEASFQTQSTNFAQSGYRMFCARACSVGGQDLYSALWEKSTGGPLIDYHGMNAETYQLTFNRLTKGGYRPLFLAGYPGSQPINAVLPFTMQKQQQSNWCWAATATSVSHFYDAGSTWTQCAVANGQLGRTDCCGTGASTACNVYGYLGDALQRVGHFDNQVSGTTSYSGVREQMLLRRPLGIRVAWSGGGAHFIAATGCEEGDLVFVSDCGSGSTSVVAYDTLRTSYAGSGSWTHSYFTK